MFRLIEKRLDLIRQMPTPLPLPERRHKSVKDLQQNGYLKLGEVVYVVSQKHRYEQQDAGKIYAWYELKLISLSDCQTVFLEWEQDDELELYLYPGQESLKLTDLKLQIADLTRFDNDEEGSFNYNGQPFIYDDSDEATFFSDNGQDGKLFYFWDFYNSAEDRCIGIEKWPDGYEIKLGQEIDEDDIEILALGSS